MDAHFKDAFAHRFAIAKIAVFGRPDAKGNPGAAHFIFQLGEPSIELIGTVKRVHALYCIHLDTVAQFEQKRAVTG